MSATARAGQFTCISSPPQVQFFRRLYAEAHYFHARAVFEQGMQQQARRLGRRADYHPTVVGCNSYLPGPRASTLSVIHNLKLPLACLKRDGRGFLARCLSLVRAHARSSLLLCRDRFLYLGRCLIKDTLITTG